MFLEEDDITYSPEEFCSSFILSSQPTLSELRQKFPFVGNYHFRLQHLFHSKVDSESNSRHSSSFSLSNTVRSDDQIKYCWIDLDQPQRILPVLPSGEIRVKVLQLSPYDSDKYYEGYYGFNDYPSKDEDLREDYEFDAYFHWKRREQTAYDSLGPTTTSSDITVEVFMSGVRKVFTSKAAKKLQKRSLKIWEKVTSATNSATSRSSPTFATPTAPALEQLAKLIGAMKQPLTTSNREHMIFLNRLWIGCFESLHPFVHQGVPWDRLGFRYTDPMRELGFLLPLNCLVFFHEVHRHLALPILNDQAAYRSRRRNCEEEDNSDREDEEDDDDDEEEEEDDDDDLDDGQCYSYGRVAAQLTFLVANMLQLKGGECLSTERPFWSLFEDPFAFFELFSIAFQAFNDSWKQQQENGEVLKIGDHFEYVVSFLEVVLGRGPTNVSSLIDFAHQMRK